MDPTTLGLPHREPFVFIKDVTEVTAGKAALGVTHFAAEEAMFRGHFPGNPIVPGVILTEALAQMAGIAGASGEGRRFLLSAIRNMKFPGAALPGEEISLAATKTGEMAGLWMFQVKAAVGERTVAEGQVVLNEEKHGE
ncbi:3-hydroxyacyl-ACP dehydratase FabZ [soil metagenome]